MTLREFNKILNNELDKFFQANNTYLHTQTDNKFFKYKINVPFIQCKTYCIGDPIYLIGTNNNAQYLIGIIGNNSFDHHFALDTMKPYLDEEVEIAIAQMLINNHKKNILGIENADIETKQRWEKELELHKNEVDKLQCIIQELHNNQEIDIEL